MNHIRLLKDKLLFNFQINNMKTLAELQELYNNNEKLDYRAWIPTTSTSEGYMAYQGEPDLETIQSFMFHYGDRHLMQFTSLLDVENQKIFEEDIIQDVYNNDKKYVIVWHENGYWAAKRKDTIYSLRDIGIFKIIGNIHENPKILEEIL